MLERRNSRRYGENHPAATLTDAEVETVRKLRDEGQTYDQIAAMMDCSKSTVAGICQNRRRNPRTDLVVERWRRKEPAGCA